MYTSLSSENFKVFPSSAMLLKMNRWGPMVYSLWPSAQDALFTQLRAKIQPTKRHAHDLRIFREEDISLEGIHGKGILWKNYARILHFCTKINVSFNSIFLMNFLQYPRLFEYVKLGYLSKDFTPDDIFTVFSNLTGIWVIIPWKLPGRKSRLWTGARKLGPRNPETFSFAAPAYLFVCLIQTMVSNVDLVPNLSNRWI